MNINRFSLVACVFFVFSLISACGGSSDSSGGTKEPTDLNIPEDGDNANEFADVIIESFDPGTSDISWPYGRNPSSSFSTLPAELELLLGDPEIERSLSDEEPIFLSIPLNYSVTIGFSDVVIVDGEGDDLAIISLSVGGDERANIYVGSSTSNLTFIGEFGEGRGADGLAIDLNGTGFQGTASVVRIEGVTGSDTTSPGYDITAVQALNFNRVSVQ